MTDNVLVDKAAWRALLLARRAQLTPEQIDEARGAVRAIVMQQVVSAGWRRVAGYEPLRTEPGSVELLESLALKGVDVLVPVLRPDRDLDWVRFGGPREPLGVQAVADVDVVVVPALAIASDGTRLGRGGGSYDRALARVAPATAVIALVYDDEFVDHLPRDAWDLPVTAAVTPAGWREVGQ